VLEVPRSKAEFEAICCEGSDFNIVAYIRPEPEAVTKQLE
jgi:hypothetical protein